MSITEAIRYRLTVIEDDPLTPLAGAIEHGQQYLPFVLILMGVCIVVFAAAVYLNRCAEYRRRIIRLGAAGTRPRGWNLVKLKEEVSRLEYVRSGEISV